jgi:hypothetical protein
MNKKRVYKDLKFEMPYLEVKHIKTIDVTDLLAAISEANPKNLADIIRIILSQPQYDVIIGE